MMGLINSGGRKFLEDLAKSIVPAAMLAGQQLSVDAHACLITNACLQGEQGNVAGVSRECRGSNKYSVKHCHRSAAGVSRECPVPPRDLGITHYPDSLVNTSE